MMRGMTLPNLTPQSLFALLAMLVGTACSTAAPPPTAPQAVVRLQAVIGDASCQSDSECRSIAAGQRACGGPDIYLAWSTRRSSVAAIERAAAGFNAASRPALPGQAASICVFLHDPGAYCQREANAVNAPGRCQLRPAGGPPGAGAPALPVR